MPSRVSPLSAELPQVVVGMQVSPAHPISIRHRTKESMVNTNLVRLAEPVHFSKSVSKILLEAAGTHSRRTLLQRRKSPEVVFPLDRLPKRVGLQNRARHRYDDRTRLYLAHSGKKGTPHMADHFCCRHQTPPPFVVGLNCCQPIRYRLPVYIAAKGRREVHKAYRSMFDHDLVCVLRKRCFAIQAHCARPYKPNGAGEKDSVADPHP